ncbi:uncharacterized protein LOC117821961 [Notolabrus celidotus]|uniref:uncharacterized protein LOC117821961 n=1 Tax=Notolabrus celidotus TaxID=1203425 RepID=UPI00149051AC|nr:uncharacterized protein LOC117821961 [Notolabrus celidotus]
MSGNIETMGTDCKVVPKHKVNSQNRNQIMKKSEVKTSAAPQSTIQRTASMLRAQQAAAAQREVQQQAQYFERSTIQRTASMLQAQQAAAAQKEAQQQAQYFERSTNQRTASMLRAQQAAAAQREVQQQADYFDRSMGASSSMRRIQQNKFSSRRSSGRQSKYATEQTNVAVINGVLPKVLNMKLYTLQSPGEELGDYAPHVYAEEENREPIDVLDAISIPDIALNPDLDLVLDSRFNGLASVCMPSKNPTYTSL